MENEGQNDNLIINPYFHILYSEQKYKNSLEYKKWKKSITEIIGENGIEIYCNEDKIIIYDKINENLICPICKEKYFYCTYCKRAEKEKTCCIRGLINDIIYNEKYYIYINSEDEENRKEFISSLLIMFIPLLFNFLLFFTIFIIFYLCRIKNDVYLMKK